MLAGVNDGESPLLCFRIVLLYSLRLKYSRQRIFVEYVLLAGVNNGLFPALIPCFIGVVTLIGHMQLLFCFLAPATFCICADAAKMMVVVVAVLIKPV